MPLYPVPVLRALDRTAQELPRPVAGKIPRAGCFAGPAVIPSICLSLCFLKNQPLRAFGVQVCHIIDQVSRYYTPAENVVVPLQHVIYLLSFKTLNLTTPLLLP